MPEPIDLTLHDDEDLLREAVNFTASRTGFVARLIEKDYFCSVLLACLTRHGVNRLVFKGGTCLAKVHAGFYRLSEDLDFTIPLPYDASRSQRRQAVAEIKNIVARVADYVPAFFTTNPLEGANNSTQYVGAIGYRSPTSGQQERILIEVSLREPLLTPAVGAPAKTLLLDPIGGDALVPAVMVNCISMVEAMAEKFRAALSRRDVAIRDFYDLEYAAQHLGLDPENAQLIELVREKLAVPGNSSVDVSDARFAALKRQLDTRLKTVLRDEAFRAFDLGQAMELVLAVAKHVV